VAAALDSFPRHLGIHNGGMVLSGTSLPAQIPIEPASMEDRTVVQWDKDALELCGWIKLDVLGLRALSAIADACEMIRLSSGQRPDLPALRFDDPQVYAMIRRGETVGVFQVESRAQASLIPRFKTRNLADLTVQIALIRPGPVQANMVHPYLRRREGTEQVEYLHPASKPALQETLGVILSATNFLAFGAMLVSSALFWLLRSIVRVSAGTIFLIAGIITIPILVAALRAELQIR
jgi:error-prone DNA polymerase